MIRSESVLELGEELRVSCFAATAGAEDRTDEGGGGDDVVDGERLERNIRIRQEVRVGAVGVGLRIGDDLFTLGQGGADPFDLVGHHLFRRRARHVGGGAGDQGEGVDAGDVDHGGASRPPAEVDEQLAVSDGHPTRAERNVFAGLAGDVSDAPLVIRERQAAAAGVDDVGFADRCEVLRQEELLDVGIGDVAAQRREAIVERELVEGVRTDGKAAVVAGRQNVVGAVPAGSTRVDRICWFGRVSRWVGRFGWSGAVVVPGVPVVAGAAGGEESASKYCGEYAVE